jgi:integrase
MLRPAAHLSPTGKEHHAEEIRQVLRRLVRRQRQQTPQSVCQPLRSRKAPAQNAGHRSIKKSAVATGLGQLAREWSAAKDPTEIDSRVAKQIEKSWGAKQPQELTANEIETLAKLWRARYAATTAHGYMKGLRRLLTHVDKIKGTRLARFVPRTLQPPARQLTCSDADFAAILSHSPIWMQTLLTLCRALGLRFDEAASVTPQHLNEDTGRINIPRKDQGTSNLRATDALIEKIRLCRQAAPFEPIIKTLGAPSTRQAIDARLKRILKKAGVREDYIFHDLRRTAITRLYEDTRDIRLCQKFAGHRSMTSTLSYITGTDPNQLDEAILRNAPRTTATIPMPTQVKQ